MTESPVAIVTGAGKGIGRATALHFARLGTRVIANARTAADLESLVAQIAGQGGTGIAVAGDVSDPALAERLAQAARGLGRCDVLVNCAGTQPLVNPIEEVPLDDWHRSIAVNLTGTFLTCRAIVPLMKAQGAGRIVNVASGLAFGLLGALQVAPWFRARHLRFHRRAGRLAILAGATAGFTALWLNRVRPPAEGMAKEIGIYVFATLMLAALTIATIQIRRGALACHRAWMLRAYAIGMAPASQVLIGLALFALPGELPVAAAVAGHYAGWIVNLALAEWAIWTGHPRPALPARRASLRHTPAA